MTQIKTTTAQRHRGKGNRGTEAQRNKGTMEQRQTTCCKLRQPLTRNVKPRIKNRRCWYFPKPSGEGHEWVGFVGDDKESI